ncbi:MAG: hypothetical protein P8Z40_15465 [Chloroflexota bacterium]|jgi:hypothetical protein
MIQPNGSAPRYQSYLLRCWEVRSQQPDRPATWRYSLQDPQTEQKHSFADLEELVDFLQAELDQNRKVESQEGVL